MSEDTGVNHLVTIERADSARYTSVGHAPVALASSTRGSPKCFCSARAQINFPVGGREARRRTLLRRLQDSQTAHGPAIHVVGMPLAPVLDAVTVLTPQLIDEGRVGIEPGVPRVPRSYPLESWFAATTCGVV